MPPNDATSEGLLLVMSGPSGVGKTTIAHHVEQQLNGQFSVSLTTRPKTEKDREGADYLFVDRATFERRRDEGQMFEWAEVFGHFYGTPRQPVLDALARGRLMILEIDVEGATQVKRHMPAAYAVFIDPPDEQALLDRLRGRGREDESIIQRRFANAKLEIRRARAGGVYDRFIVNDDLARARQEAVDIVAERIRKRP